MIEEARCSTRTDPRSSLHGIIPYSYKFASPTFGGFPRKSGTKREHADEARRWQWHAPKERV